MQIFCIVLFTVNRNIVQMVRLWFWKNNDFGGKSNFSKAIANNSRTHEFPSFTVIKNSTGKHLNSRVLSHSGVLTNQRPGSR